MNSNTTIARNLNNSCLCKTLDQKIFLDHLQDIPELEILFSERPHLFSSTAIFISSDELDVIKDTILSIEDVVSNSSFQQKALSRNHPIASRDFGPHGVFMGYDFHLSEEGPKLIEVNTNAGGAFLNLLLAKAQLSCCEEARPPVDLAGLEDKFFEIFEQEWQRQKKGQELKVLAIMDENPGAQYLFPEFKLFEHLFKRKGLDAFIVDPSLIESRADGLWFQDKKIDLIYNRATDFYFESEKYEAVKAAYLAGQVVVTPNPHHHALFADKENLEILTSEEELSSLGIGPSARKVLLSTIPRTLKVTFDNQPGLWTQRKDYFFKPTKGYGSKAAYRGDKITHRVWEEIKKSSYVAQKLIPPGVRLIENEGKEIELKHDLRAYTYNGEVLLLASRIYMGQTTNFRTSGGGFAPVFVIRDIGK